MQIRYFGQEHLWLQITGQLVELDLPAEFISKMAIVEEEADESLFWLELLGEMEIFNQDQLEPLMRETNELIAIVVASIKTCRRKK